MFIFSARVLCLFPSKSMCWLRRAVFVLFDTAMCKTSRTVTTSVISFVKCPSVSINNAHSCLGYLGCLKELTGCPKHETSSPTSLLLTNSVFRPNLVSEPTSFCLVPGRAIFGLRLSFLHTRFYFAMNGLVILRRARIALLCEFHLLDHSYLIKPSLP